VSTLDTFLGEKSKLCIVQEFDEDYLEFQKYLDERERLIEFQILRYTAIMALSLLPFDRLGIHHGDLRPSCFVIKRIKGLSNYIALKEFALGKLVRAAYPSQAVQKDVRYQSPERVDGKEEEYLDK
jgi:hypothetical protein